MKWCLKSCRRGKHCVLPHMYVCDCAGYKVTSAFTATIANLLTKTINVSNHNIKTDFRRNVVENFMFV